MHVSSWLFKKENLDWCSITLELWSLYINRLYFIHSIYYLKLLDLICQNRSSMRSRALSTWFVVIVPVLSTRKALNIHLKKWKNEWNPFYSQGRVFSFTQWIEYFLLSIFANEGKFSDSCATEAGEGNDGLQSSWAEKPLVPSLPIYLGLCGLLSLMRACQQFLCFCSVFRRPECESVSV